MCNLYSMISNQEAIRRLFGVDVDSTGNLGPLPGIYPDHAAPIVRHAAGGREVTMARWGLPTPPKYLKGRRADPGVTNIRNATSAHWRRWLGAEARCVVPFTSFAEPLNGPPGARPPVWFALAEDRPLACFAGIWCKWASVRKVREGEVSVDCFGFLTTGPNAEVGEVHPKAMPVILRTPAEVDTWMAAPIAEALKLQRPLPDGSLRIVARGAKTDEAVNA